MDSLRGHTYTFALQKYMLLQEQHQELCCHLEQMRPRQSSNASSVSSVTSSPTRPSPFPPSLRHHSRGSERRRPSASPRKGSWDDSLRRSDTLDTIVDEDTIYEISAEEQRLSDVNESIKRALTELLNCDTVRCDSSMRLWTQTRLMETERELRSGRRRKSSPCMD